MFGAGPTVQHAQRETSRKDLKVHFRFNRTPIIRLKTDDVLQVRGISLHAASLTNPVMAQIILNLISEETNQPVIIDLCDSDDEVKVESPPTPENVRPIGELIALRLTALVDQVGRIRDTNKPPLDYESDYWSFEHLIEYAYENRRAQGKVEAESCVKAHEHIYVGTGSTLKVALHAAILTNPVMAQNISY